MFKIGFSGAMAVDTFENCRCWTSKK